MKGADMTDELEPAALAPHLLNRRQILRGTMAAGTGALLREAQARF
jgi:hypothetical protein